MKRILSIVLAYCLLITFSLASPIEVIIYSATAWYRHPEIPKLNGFLVRLGAEQNINVSVTEDPNDLKTSSLKKYDLLFLNNSTNLGESIPKEIQKDIINWFNKGGGIMAMHAGIVQNGTWPELINIAGCDYDSDSDFVEARFLIDPKAEGDPLVAGKKKEFTYTADWLCFNKTVTGLPGVEVILRLDENSYTPIRKHPNYVGKKPMGDDHPICWRRKVGEGRYLFTGLGHDVRSIDNDFAKRHLIAGIRWAANSVKKDVKK